MTVKFSMAESSWFGKPRHFFYLNYPESKKSLLMGYLDHEDVWHWAGGPATGGLMIGREISEKQFLSTLGRGKDKKSPVPAHLRTSENCPELMSLGDWLSGGMG